MDEWLKIGGEATEIGSTILTQSQCERLSVVRKGGLMGIRWLSSYARTNGLRRYNLIPKVHHMDEALRRALRTKIIFSAFWCFRQGDMMGLSALISKRVHASKVSCRTMDRWLSTILCGGY